MAFRFRKSFKIAPGIRLNLSKKGIGMSAGVKGARVGINSKGTYTSVGIPGTGISSISYSKTKQLEESPVISPVEKEIKIRKKISAAGWCVLIAVIFIFIQPLISVLLFLLAFFLKRRSKKLIAPVK